MTTTQLIALSIALAACAHDLSTRRIPNWLTFGSAGAAIVVHAIAAGFLGAGFAIAGWLVGAALFFPLFMLRGLGAGDVKLLAALGAWVGPVEALHIALFGTIAGGLAALIVAAAHNYTREAVTNVRRIFASWRTTSIGPVPGVTLATSHGPRLAYALPIAIGTGVALWLR